MVPAKAQHVTQPLQIWQAWLVAGGVHGQGGAAGAARAALRLGQGPLGGALAGGPPDFRLLHAVLISCKRRRKGAGEEGSEEDQV